VSRALHVLERYLPRGAVIVSVLYAGSYVVGLVRERLLAGTFGAGAELDAFNAAFQLPELLFDVLVEAGLAAAFIPIFARLRATPEGIAAADRFARTVLALTVAIMGAGSILLFAFADPLTELIAPGFRGQQRDLYLGLFRVMLVTQVVFAASLTLSQVLLAERRYFWFAVAPIVYSGGIILGTVALGGRLGIYGAALGAVLGSVLHLATRIVGLRGSSFRVLGDVRVRTVSMREFVRLTLPRLVSQPVEPVTFAFFTNVASRLAAGSLTVFSMARNFQSAPVSFIGASFALAAFPALSDAHAAGDRPAFLRLLGRNLASIGALTVAAAIVMALVGRLAIGILLGGGAFGADAVAATADVLSVFALSVPFESVSQLLSRAIFATRHTLFQAMSSIAGMVVTVGTTLALVSELDVIALPLGFAIGQVAKTVLLGIVLLWRLGTFPSMPVSPAQPSRGVVGSRTTKRPSRLG
jgi:putative peptidoglycan lipid II flippase